MRWWGPDALAVCLAHQGLPVGFFFCSGIQFYLLLSPIFALSPCFILIYMFKEIMH